MGYYNSENVWVDDDTNNPYATPINNYDNNYNNYNNQTYDPPPYTPPEESIYDRETREAEYYRQNPVPQDYCQPEESPYAHINHSQNPNGYESNTADINDRERVQQEEYREHLRNQEIVRKREEQERLNREIEEFQRREALYGKKETTNEPVIASQNSGYTNNTNDDSKYYTDLKAKKNSKQKTKQVNEGRKEPNQSEEKIKLLAGQVFEDVKSISLPVGKVSGTIGGALLAGAGTIGLLTASAMAPAFLAVGVGGVLASRYLHNQKNINEVKFHEIEKKSKFHTFLSNGATAICKGFGFATLGALGITGVALVVAQPVVGVLALGLAAYNYKKIGKYIDFVNTQADINKTSRDRVEPNFPLTREDAQKRVEQNIASMREDAKPIAPDFGERDYESKDLNSPAYIRRKKP